MCYAVVLFQDKNLGLDYVESQNIQTPLEVLNVNLIKQSLICGKYPQVNYYVKRRICHAVVPFLFQRPLGRF